MCYRCSNNNPLMNPAGNVCSTCSQPFVHSFLTFGKPVHVFSTGMLLLASEIIAHYLTASIQCGLGNSNLGDSCQFISEHGGPSSSQLRPLFNWDLNYPYNSNVVSPLYRSRQLEIVYYCFDQDPCLDRWWVLECSKDEATTAFWTLPNPDLGFGVWKNISKIIWQNKWLSPEWEPSLCVFFSINKHVVQMYYTCGTWPCRCIAAGWVPVRRWHKWRGSTEVTGSGICQTKA